MTYKETEKFKEVYKNISTRLKEQKKKGVWGNLLKEVVRTGKCIRCGACASSCDVLGWNIEKNLPELTGKCTACGTCYYQCPAIKNNENENFGSYLKTYSGTTKIPEVSSITYQNGGIVSSILYYLLKEEGFDGAVVVQKDPQNPWFPQAKYIDSIEAINSSSGTIYTHAQTIPPLMDAIISKNAKKIAFVGTPCNIDSVSTMYETEGGLINSIGDIEIVKIAIFCMEAFVPESLYSQFETDSIDIKSVSKMEISSGKFKLFDGEQQLKSYPIKDLEPMVDSSCHFCRDFTGENSDISVGNVGTPDDENSIIIRSERGQSIIDKMSELGYIELKRLSRDGISKISKISKGKKNKVIPDKVTAPVVQKEFFILHDVADWADANYGFTPIVMDDKYERKEFNEVEINSVSSSDVKLSKLDESPDVFLAKIPDVDGEETIPYNYSSAYDLTIKMLKNYDKIKDGKIFIKPNNTGFVGVFKTDALKHVLERNGITDNADDQQIATQPSIVKGMVDALLDLGAKRIDIGENMLWNGGTPRAFYETGYTKIFADRKYKGKVFFVDFYENDPPAASLERLLLEKTDYNKVDYYNRCFPPKALFKEKYDLVYIASVIKTHNCSHYSLSIKNFSVSWNPRKKTGNIPPRWQMHGLPVNLFHKKYVQEALGADFKRKYKYFVREVYKYPWKNPDQKQRIVKKKNRKVIVTNEFASSGLMDTITSWGNYAFDVDPHHWTGMTLSIMNLGMGYLITRYTRVFSAVLKELKKYGTRVACLCSGVVAQELDGPLVYGSKKYGGFAAASFDHVALEKVVLDVMFGTDKGGFRKYITEYQKEMMKESQITDPDVLKDAEDLWTLKMLQDFIGGELDNTNMNLSLLDYTKNSELTGIGADEVYKLRRGATFLYSKAIYVSPIAWLRAMHTDDGLAMHAFVADKKSIEVPLIPGVVK